MISQEVARQVALENVEAQGNAQSKESAGDVSSIAHLMSDGQPHVFVAGKELDLTDATGQECAVTDGDVLQLTGPLPADATAANLTVLSSKGGVECARQATVAVGVENLQEMQNHMRETVDLGLQELQAKQGKGGLPAAPPSALAPPTDALIAQNAPPPDPTAAKELTAQAQEADKAEQEVVADTSAGSAAGGTGSGAAPAAANAPAGAPATVSLGQSFDEVKAALGPPGTILNLGPKTVYVYQGMKVTFKGGKVSDVE